MITLFTNNLKLDDAALLIEILQALGYLLQLDKAVPLRGDDSIAYKFELAGGLDEIENLQKHPNLSVYQEVEKLVRENFDQEEEMAEESLPTQSTSQTQSNPFMN